MNPTIGIKNFQKLETEANYESSTPTHILSYLILFLVSSGYEHRFSTLEEAQGQVRGGAAVKGEQAGCALGPSRTRKVHHLSGHPGGFILICRSISKTGQYLPRLQKPDFLKQLKENTNMSFMFTNEAKPHFH